MKTVIFALSILTLVSYGCNRSTTDKSTNQPGVERQEDDRSQDMNYDQGTVQESNESMGTTPTSEGSGTQE